MNELLLGLSILSIMAFIGLLLYIAVVAFGAMAVLYITIILVLAWILGNIFS